MVEHINVANKTVEQIALTERRQLARCQRNKAAEGKDAQVLQNAEGRVMANQPLKIAGGSARDSRAAYACSR